MTDHPKAFEIEDDGSVIGYMCLTDYEYHLGQDAKPTPIYTSIDSLRRERSCVDSCGIIAVKVFAYKVIQESNEDQMYDKPD